MTVAGLTTWFVAVSCQDLLGFHREQTDKCIDDKEYMKYIHIFFRFIRIVLMFTSHPTWVSQ